MKKKRYIGIDLGTFTSVHSGGKDEVAYNIIRGLAEKGLASELMVFCTRDLNEKIKNLHEEIKIVNYPQIKGLNYFIRRDVLRILFFKYLCCRYSFSSILFTDKGSPGVKLPVRTIVIPHDIQVFEMGRIIGITYSDVLAGRLRKMILDDFRFRDIVVAISEFDKNSMERYFSGYKTKLCRIYDPVRFLSFSVGSGQRKKYITAINIQWIHKNVVTLIQAFSQVANQISYDLMLVGKKGESAEIIDEAIDRSPYRERIHVAGFISQENLEQIVNETILYVNPSYFEGFGLTAVEMMGYGIPVLVADNTAQKEVTLSLCNYYKPSNDVTKLAEALLDSLNCQKSAVDLRKIACKIREKYDYRYIAEEYCNLLKCKNG